MTGKWAPLRRAFLGRKAFGFIPRVHNPMRVAMGLEVDPPDWEPDDEGQFKQQVAQSMERLAEYHAEIKAVEDEAADEVLANTPAMGSA